MSLFYIVLYDCLYSVLFTLFICLIVFWIYWFVGLSTKIPMCLAYLLCTNGKSWITCSHFQIIPIHSLSVPQWPSKQLTSSLTVSHVDTDVHSSSNHLFLVFSVLTYPQKMGLNLLHVVVNVLQQAERTVTTAVSSFFFVIQSNVFVLTDYKTPLKTQQGKF